MHWLDQAEISYYDEKSDSDKIRLVTAHEEDGEVFLRFYDDTGAYLWSLRGEEYKETFFFG